MISYPPTTLLPSYLPYLDLDTLISILCDNCLRYQYDESLPPSTKDQQFDLTISIIEFWCDELSDEDTLW